jgi:predicted O-methyltransferase YrrM
VTKLEEILEAGSDSVHWFGGRYNGGIYLQQSPYEFVQLIEFLSDKNIRNYLEIGAASGGTAYLMNRFLDLDNIYLIDDNKHYRSKFRKEILKDVKYKEFIGDSHSPEAIHWVVDSDLFFDVVFVDGDHSYEGVKRDTLDYLHNLNSGGYLILHDIITQRVGVKDWYWELKEKDYHLKHIIDFIDKDKQLGIGVFQKGAKNAV